MAMLRRTLSITSGIFKSGALRSGLNVRCASSTPGRDEAVVITDDGRTIVAWHPEPQIPYEMTMPLPEQSKADTILKVEDANAMKKLFRHQHPFFVRKELQDLTYTTKHPWFPRPGRRFAKKNPPRDREYL
ncbi:large ribosomal subunit protein mL42-like [Palaemon carinicauda]|uniref:large ribosomal subunit protein mL42-like n=1 Tax=Palaemon carinicauda TaxID=392227 RepID=UPI0035B60643